ncbi:MAG TPA: glycoside hydrolase family 38 C-terminal domain-containing protein, partial [Candidatus Hydrogenedentes bacterium]|nr:glycoside hydrolase family 38 C-terminal domain-containing protein [Candidatus Hydrogenedentota bacterium]
PQMYMGFGIDNIIFYRGINTPKSEFIWEGPDGTRLLGMRFGTMSRFSYYIYVYRYLRYGSDDVWARYDWDRGAAPFRLARADKPREHYHVLDKHIKQWNDKPIRDQLLKLVKDESEHFTTSHICCMQGFDTSDPDPEESRIMKLCQKLLPEHDIKLSDLDTYMKAMRKEVKNPAVLTGESRDPGSTGKWTHLMGDVISARTRLKRANHKAEVHLQRLAEPWSAIGSMVGGEYVKTGIDKCWKLLLQNHPHDTITGAGIDQMEKDSLFRFDQICIISEGLARRGMGAVQIAIDNSDLSPKDSVLTVYNPCPFPRSGVVSAYIDMPANMGYDAFSIRTPDGKKVSRIQRKEQFEWGTLVRNLQDISIELNSQRVLCHIEVEDIPAFGYKTYHIVREEKWQFEPGSLAVETNVIENEHLRVKFNSDGTLDVTHKPTKQTYAGLHYLEDTGETGHSWIHMEPHSNEAITSHGFPCVIALEEAGPLLARVRVEYHMEVPIGIDDEMTDQFRGDAMDHTSRTKERKKLIVTSRFTLRAGQQRLDVVTSLDNQCRNHRLRVMFPTGLRTNQTHTDATYDVIARDITVKKGNAYYGKPNPQYPMYRWVDMSDGKKGFAILNTGIREYEAMDNKERTLGITLFRAFTYRNCPIFGRWEVHPEMDLAQCIGPHEWTYSIYPHKGDWTNGVFNQAEELNLPLDPAQCGPHKGTLPKSLSFLTLSGGNVQLTAFKQHEDRPGSYTVRVFNPEAKSVTAKLTFAKPIKKAWFCNLNEERRKEVKPVGKALTVPLGKKKIATVEIVF